jgi:hypothetical protein
MLDNLSRLNPIDSDYRCSDVLACWRNAIEYTTVCTLAGDVCRNSIAFGNLLHDLNLDVGESGEKIIKE